MMDLEQAREIRNSVIWGWIKEELEYRISCEEKALRYIKPEKLTEVQQKIQALEELKNLPDTVVDREDSGTD